MKIIICGLPGTGKTTLSKMISQKYGLRLVSDWDIFAENNIAIDKFEDKNNISDKYSKLLMDWLLTHDNVIADFEYSISPSDFLKFCNNDICVIYLGFVSMSKKKLFNIFRRHEGNEKYSDDVLKEKICFYKTMSLGYKKQCNQANLKFFDIDKDRETVFNEILQYLEI